MCVVSSIRTKVLARENEIYPDMDKSNGGKYPKDTVAFHVPSQIKL